MAPGPRTVNLLRMAVDEAIDAPWNKYYHKNTHNLPAPRCTHVLVISVKLVRYHVNLAWSCLDES